jgi:hypothetical protein
MDKIKIKRITLIRAEGPTYQCGQVHAVENWTQANSLLLGWSDTAPKGGAADKVDYRIRFADGFECPGTYALRHWEDERPDLQGRLRSIADFYMGKRCPEGWSMDRFRQHLEQPYTRRLAEAYGELLHAYDI